MSYIVVEHTLDETEGVYRLVVGFTVDVERPMLDDNGEVVTETVEVQLPAPVLPEGESWGEKIVAEEGEEIPQAAMPPEPPESNGLTEVITHEVQMPVTETVAQVVATEDFVFAADDPRWERFKGPETIAAKQREIVREVLEQREQAATEAAAREAARTVLSDPGATL